MSNPSGTRFERELVDVAIEDGWPDAKRLAKAGARDPGDLEVFPGVTLEAKAEKSMNLAGAIEEARVEAGNNGHGWFAAVVKRRGKNARHAYYVQEWEQACRRERLYADRELELFRLRTEVATLERALELVGRSAS